MTERSGETGAIRGSARTSAAARRQQSCGWPLLFRSGHSLLRGVGTPGEWVARAAEAGYELVAQADWASFYGALTFLEEAEGRGLSGVLGAELPLADGRLLCFCQDLCGYRNLAEVLTLLGDGYPPPFRSGGEETPAHDGEEDDPVLRGAGLTEPEIPKEELLELLCRNAAGLVLFCSCPQAVRVLRRACAGSALALLAPWPLPRQGVPGLEQQARRLGVAVAVLPEASQVDSEQAGVLRLLAAIRARGLLSETPAPRGGGTIPTGEILQESQRLCPGALRQGTAMLERCRLRSADLKPRTFIFPRVGGDDGRARLRADCEAGLRGRGLEASRPALRRLEQELATIEQLGFVDYFLATAEIARWAHCRGIPAVGRGSGVSSLVAYLLEITAVNPIEYGLYFERFLHPLRGHDYPDLDIDIAWHRRDEVLAYALGAFGAERGGMVSTHQFYRPRGAFRDAGRALGIDDHTLTKAGRAIPFEGMGGTGDGRAREGLARLRRDGDRAIQRAARAAEHLVGRPRGIGVHVGGIVLGEMALRRTVPLERSANGIVITQFDMHGVEKIGLIKIDLLGNRALATHADTIAVLAQRGEACDLDRIPHSDPETATLLAGGRTLGCFQLESPAMRTLLRQVRATNMEDAIATLALVRPGPASSGMKQAYIRRARRAEKPRAPHASVEHILSRTYGIPLFEEDVMCLAAETGGLSYGEADMLRRAIGEAVREARADDGAGPRAKGAGSAPKARADSPRLGELRRGFLAAAGRFGRAAAGEIVWDELVRFASYSFCKAHAAGFGVLAYQSAYLKTHYPGAFFASLLNHHQGMYPTRVHVDEARRHGLTPLPPCVQRGGSGWTWEPEGDRLRCGLSRVRNLHRKTLARILEVRRASPFRDLTDFVARARPNALELEALLLAGCLDEALGLPRGELVWQSQRLLRVRGSRGRTDARLSAPANQVGLELRKGRANGSRGSATAPPAWREISPRHRAGLERRFLGVSLTLHPMGLFPTGLPPEGERLTVEAVRRGDRRRAALSGIVSATRSFVSQGGKPMLFFTLEDETGLVEGILDGEQAADRLRRPRLDDFFQCDADVTRNFGACGLRTGELRVVGRHE